MTSLGRLRCLLLLLMLQLIPPWPLLPSWTHLLSLLTRSSALHLLVMLLMPLLCSSLLLIPFSPLLRRDSGLLSCNSITLALVMVSKLDPQCLNILLMVPMIVSPGWLFVASGRVSPPHPPKPPLVKACASIPPPFRWVWIVEGLIVVCLGLAPICYCVVLPTSFLFLIVYDYV